MELEMAGPANVGAEPLSPRPEATLVTEGIEPEPRRQMRRRPPDAQAVSKWATMIRMALKVQP